MAGSLLVAVVDDDASVRKAIRRLLTAAKHRVEAFASGEDFLISLAEQVPDCLILDLHMPGLTGLEVQRQIVRAGMNFPTVVITAHDEGEAREQCMSAGVAAYLQKPIDDQVLLDAIAASVRRTLPPENRGNVDQPKNT
jgi:FixJ family two-component response regulator